MSAAAGTGRREGKAETPERRLSDACRLEGGAPGTVCCDTPPPEGIVKAPLPAGESLPRTYRWGSQ